MFTVSYGTDLSCTVLNWPVSFTQLPRLLVQCSIIVRDPISRTFTAKPTDRTLVSTFESEVRNLPL